MAARSAAVQRSGSNPAAWAVECIIAAAQTNAKPNQTGHVDREADRTFGPAWEGWRVARVMTPINLDPTVPLKPYAAWEPAWEPVDRPPAGR